MKQRARPKQAESDPVVSFRIDAKQLKVVQELAKAKDRTVSYVLRELISIGLGE